MKSTFTSAFAALLPLALTLSLSHPLTAQNLGTVTATDVQVDSVNTNKLKLATGATAGHVLQSDANGNASWVSPLLLPNGSWTTSGNDQYSAVSGNVGIGTSSPDNPLTVQGTGANSELLGLKNNAGATKWHLNLLSGGLNFAETGVADARLFLSPGGNVGIGTSSPGSRLQVTGGIRARGGAPGAFGANNNGYAFSGNGGDSDGGMFSTADGQLEFYTDNVERIRINASGNVGIGTTSPTERLHVNGNIRLADDADILGTNLIEGFNNLFFKGDASGGTDFQIEASGNAGFGATYPNVGLTVRNPSSFNDIIFRVENTSGTDVFTALENGDIFAPGIPFGDHENMQYDAGSGEFYYDNSSRRYKENITPLTDDWRLILQARPATYTRPGSPDRWEVGYIAEEMDSLGLTKLVSYDSAGIPNGFNYEKMILYVVEILKDHDEKVALLAAQQAEIEALKTQTQKIADLEAKLAALLEMQAANTAARVPDR